MFPGEPPHAIPSNPLHKTVQGGSTSNRTWTQPPLDTPITAWQLFDFHLKYSGNHPLFQYYNPANGELKTISWGKTVQAIHKRAQSIRDLAGGTTEHRKVIGILAISDTITYSILCHSIIRTGHIPFPISPRLSPPMLAHLLEKTHPEYIFVSGIEGKTMGVLQNLLQSAITLLDPTRDSTSQPYTDKMKDLPQIVPMPSFQDLFQDSQPAKEEMESNETAPTNVDSVALILHSSGSTAFPKAINITHRFMFEQGMLPWFGDVDLCGLKCSSHSLPMFHSAGHVPFTWAISSGLVLTVLPPVSPPLFPTPNIAFEGMEKTRSQVVYGISMHIEEWAKDETKIEYMRNMAAVIYQGAPLSVHTGKLLISTDVPVVPMYGMTEGGAMSSLIPARTSERDYEYFKFSPHYTTEFLEQGPGQDGIYELVLPKTANQTPARLNTTSATGAPAYATSDLLVRHPSEAKDDFWKIYGRKDHQITLSLGEKVNPGPLESLLVIHASAYIRSAILFGRVRAHLGVLLDPIHPFDPADVIKLAEFRNMVWPAVEKVNQVAPAFGRLSKEMIVPTWPSLPLSYSIKGDPHRHLALQAYAHVIEAAYEAAYETSQTELPGPRQWDNEEDVKNFIRAVVAKILGDATSSTRFQDNTDFYAAGCDSLQTTWIKNSILYALRRSHGALGQQLPQDFVYLHPTVLRLSLFLVKCIRGELRPQEFQDEHSALDTMLILKNEAVAGIRLPSLTGIDSVTPKRSPVQGDIVLVTGTTGALGCYILGLLLSDAFVHRVYAANRPSPNTGHHMKSLAQRQEEAFIEKGLDVSLLQSQKLVLVEMDARRADLGVETQIYETIQHSVTHIIHNAWPVQFGYTISSFRESFQGLKNLINFCLQVRGHKPCFIYISSVAAFRNYNGDGPVLEEKIADFSQAIGFGYGESKLVSEHILQHAADVNGLSFVSIRVGQLSGGINGVWSTKEWVPTLVRAGIEIGCLPSFKQKITWLPINIAAQVIIEMRNSPHQYLHLVHPHPVSWSEIFEHVAAMLGGIALVDPDQWTSKIQEIGTENSRGSLDLFKKLYQGHNADPLINTEKATRMSKTLADGNIHVLGESDVKKWITYWISKGFL
ncbi:acetyl-CoA synthetase-like protein [Gymnopus androsaceus JB14]|uniref:Acetyl-CoA synthetase-like protein n=1 Tax=Gymnopus androsaceus JB14 TaxID=1447944 RepID=A0A6A4HGX9_9AGAR|nr:acetyl-CoA synthetase-like protein [Gymnopus androsaceus JB14]